MVFFGYPSESVATPTKNILMADREPFVWMRDVEDGRGKGMFRLSEVKVHASKFIN